MTFKLDILGLWLDLVLEVRWYVCSESIKNSKDHSSTDEYYIPFGARQPIYNASHFFMLAEQIITLGLCLLPTNTTVLHIDLKGSATYFLMPLPQACRYCSQNTKR